MIDGNFSIERQIRFNIHRCGVCARWWAIENGHAGRCPWCAIKTIEDGIEREAKLERSMRSLRGAFTRMRDRVKGASNG